MNPYPCHEDETFTTVGCVHNDALTDAHVVLDRWDCTTDGNRICGSDPDATLAFTGTDWLATLVLIGWVLVTIGVALLALTKRRWFW